MSVFQYIYTIILFLIIYTQVNCVENSITLETLWNLTGYALQSRQRYPSFSQNVPIIPINQQVQHLSGPAYRPQGGIRDDAAGYYPNLKQYYPTFQGQNAPEYNKFPHTKYPYNPIHGSPANYGLYGSLRPQIGYPQRPIGPNFGYPPQQSGPLSLLPSRESFMEALDSIARNDELHCVPRILCEVTSGTLSARQSGFKLPFNINMESIVGLLSGFNGMDTNPLISFGKAVLLGYSAKGNAGTCMYAYPQCPRDPDRLVEYLNNYNGGFFRFFNGLDTQNLQQGNAQFPGQQHQNLPFRPGPYPGGSGFGLYNPYRGYNYKVNKAEKRILTRPSEFDITGNRFLYNDQQKGIKFPNDIDEFNNELNPPYNFHSHNGDSIRTLKFPIRHEDTYGGPLRKPKQLPDFYFSDETNFQRPSPNHRPTPMIFPDRTGTGELKFNPEELSENYRRPFALQNNNLISFNSETNNDPFYYINSDSNVLRQETYDFNRQNNRFFPS